MQADPERLKQILELRLYRASTLANEAQISQSHISDFLRNRRNLSISAISSISSVLGVNESYFYNSPIIADSPIFFRSFSNASKLERASSKRRIEWLLELVRFIEQRVQLPQFNLPLFITNEHQLLRVTNQEIEEFAKETRIHFNLGFGVIESISRLIENHGVILSTQSFGTDTLDALSMFSENSQRAFMLYSKASSKSRTKFNLAHELGHLVLHRWITTSDQQSRFHARLEEQANQFASAFLLPANAISNDFSDPSMRSLLLLKLKWQVSVKALIYRLKKLNLINDSSERNLYINYSKNGWNRIGEPLEDKIKPESPLLLSKCLELLLTDGGYTPSDITNELHIGLKDVSEMICDDILFQRFKPEHHSNLRLLKSF